MSGRGAALWVIAVLSAVAVAGLAVAVAARLRSRALNSLTVLALAVGVTCGWWAVIGWAWLLTGGAAR